MKRYAPIIAAFFFITGLTIFLTVSITKGPSDPTIYKIYLLPGNNIMYSSGYTNSGVNGVLTFTALPLKKKVEYRGDYAIIEFKSSEVEKQFGGTKADVAKPNKESGQVPTQSGPTTP